MRVDIVHTYLPWTIITFTTNTTTIPTSTTTNPSTTIIPTSTTTTTIPASTNTANPTSTIISTTTNPTTTISASTTTILTSSTTTSIISTSTISYPTTTISTSSTISTTTIPASTTTIPTSTTTISASTSTTTSSTTIPTSSTTTTSSTISSSTTTITTPAIVCCHLPDPPTPTPTPVMATYTEKKLFTPGPLCVPVEVKGAMGVDLGSRDHQFISCVAQVRAGLLKVAQVSAPEYTCVPLQGSGTYCVEAVVNTASPRDNKAKVLVLVNGAYGRRIVQMCEKATIPVTVVEGPEHLPISLQEISRIHL
ncbi:hypothetical protein Pcinc_018981 [Petrolisthes cinctipes]|uniref:Uncharacterized protein n=1 Tax=Petrolisthes cinctipes TaxID=88211 RepID=A0AAE1KIC4_PETCI|nr:hypothetical protein Pcinc_018981 [Petrolisthes cinctipes]